MRERSLKSVKNCLEHCRNLIRQPEYLKLHLVVSTSLIVVLLFLIFIRDWIAPYQVEAYLAGSVYENPEPVESGQRRIQVVTD